MLAMARSIAELVVTVIHQMTANWTALDESREMTIKIGVGLGAVGLLNVLFAIRHGLEKSADLIGHPDQGIGVHALCFFTFRGDPPACLFNPGGGFLQPRFVPVKGIMVCQCPYVPSHTH